MTDDNMQLSLFAQLKATEKEPKRSQTSEKKFRSKKNDSESQANLSTNEIETEIISREDGTTMQETPKPADFETMIAELEKVVATLEGELKLEQALALFERGLGLSQNCEKYLQSAQQRIEILRRASNGEITTEAFAQEAEAIPQP